MTPLENSLKYIDHDGPSQEVGPEWVEIGSTPDNDVTKSLLADGLVVQPVGVGLETVAPEKPDTDLAFGIADAIQLMRSLPHDPQDENTELVGRVVGVTLGAANVSIDEIVQDAHRAEKVITETIAALQSQVDDLEKTLYSRRCDIAAHQAELDETISVREQLYVADQHTRLRPPPIPMAALRIPSNRGRNGRVASGHA